MAPTEAVPSDLGRRLQAASLDLHLEHQRLVQGRRDEEIPERVRTAYSRLAESSPPLPENVKDYFDALAEQMIQGIRLAYAIDFLNNRIAHAASLPPERSVDALSKIASFLPSAGLGEDIIPLYHRLLDQAESLDFEPRSQVLSAVATSITGAALGEKALPLYERLMRPSVACWTVLCKIIDAVSEADLGDRACVLFEAAIEAAGGKAIWLITENLQKAHLTDRSLDLIHSKLMDLAQRDDDPGDRSFFYRCIAVSMAKIGRKVQAREVYSLAIDDLSRIDLKKHPGVVVDYPDDFLVMQLGTETFTFLNRLEEIASTISKQEYRSRASRAIQEVRRQVKAHGG